LKVEGWRLEAGRRPKKASRTVPTRKVCRPSRSEFDRDTKTVKGRRYREDDQERSLVAPRKGSRWPPEGGRYREEGDQARVVGMRKRRG